MMPALRKAAAASPGSERYPFALGLATLVAHTRGPAPAFAPLENTAANELVVTPQVMLGLLSGEECARIVAHCEAQPLHDGQVNQQRPDYRSA
jgi:hypothetical protein